MDIQKESLLILINITNELNVRGGLTLEESYRLFSAIDRLKTCVTPDEIKNIIQEIFDYLHKFQRAGKMTINESFVVYACMSSFIRNTDEKFNDLCKHVIENSNRFL
jgi:hypothetical protein